MADRDRLSIDTSTTAGAAPPPPAVSAGASQASSSRPSPVSQLTTFPNPFQDEPEPGLLPSLISKVKSTFGGATPQAPPPPSEAQQIAEAARKSGVGQGTKPTGPKPTQKPPAEAPTAPAPKPKQPAPPSSSQPTSASSSAATSVAPSVTSAPRRHLMPGERWRPAGASPAQVTVSPITSLTTTGPQHPEGLTPIPTTAPSVVPSFTNQPATPALPQIDITNAKGSAIHRIRRGSISTIPDSPSSASLNAMMSNPSDYNNFSFVPGFQLPADDTRSVRSFALAKRPGSVSKIIRRMRGEGLSKHYWMADENCKECYDCKSVSDQICVRSDWQVFTTWRRKHHCRICGQIFCGRCASNIIGARRFGQDGMVRVCNLCLKIMEDYDDEDDRRSISSGISSLPDRVFSPEVSYAQSPFAASQLLRSHAANESLSAIDETDVPRYWNRDPDRPFTPEGVSEAGSDTEEDGLWTGARPSTAAPFRRQDDEASDDHHNQVVPHGTPPNLGNEGDRRDFPTTPHHFFPRTETMDSETDPRYFALMDSTNGRPGIRSRLSSANSVLGINALLDSDRKDGLWRARSQSFVTPPEFLCGPSLAHFNTMLQQAIETADLSTPAQWHRVLGRLLLRVSTNVRPVLRAGDSIDVRAYIKIKKVPGGKISDSEYVDGIVITKNVAHKGMSRRLVNPRIMVVTFPLDYHRVETQFMSLDPIMKQERDYLRLLTKRIIDLRPHIVLAERFVSRIALDYLYQANIVVARGVKYSAVHQVARCTHADIIASMDRLALEPRLGRCAEFRVQTFENEAIPGRRKTYMRFEGTHNGFGGTIILRGGELATLRKVKVIADFMSLVAYHLKNETFLYGDEFHMLPPHPPMPQKYQELLAMLAEDEVPSKIYGRPVNSTSNEEDSDELTPRALPERDEERADALRLTKDIAESLRPYLVTVLSASVAVRFPPPHPLAKMADLDRQLNHLLLQKDEKEAQQILQEELRIPSGRFEAIEDEKDKAQEKEKPQEKGKEDEKESKEDKDKSNDEEKQPEADATPKKAPEKPALGEPIIEEIGSDTDTEDEKVLSSNNETPRADDTPRAERTEFKPLTPVAMDSSPESSTSSKRSSQLGPAPSTAAPSASTAPTSIPPSSSVPSTSTPSQILPTPASKGDPYRVLLNPADFEDATKLAFVEYEHAEQLKVWEHYVRKHDEPLDPQNYQGIIYTQALFRQGQDKPCTEFARQQINYYQDDDQSLGQFLDGMVNNAGLRCPGKNCEQLMLFHYDVLVHGERRLQIVMEQFMCPLVGHEEQILTWSYCRQCNKSWEPQVMRDETSRISWGTYLEHCFYPPQTNTGFGCTHDAYREHIRYFAHRNMVIRIHNDEIELFEPVRPPTKLLVRVEDKVRIKNQEYESALQRTAAFFDSVLFRLRSFSEELVHPEKLSSMRVERDALLARAVADRDEMVNSLNRTYKQTPPTDVLAINVVLQTLQEKVIQWE
ncbi:1-phosphatidylinositol-3-phosphate 5-kinase [Trichosporon asahii var. asahii CBS 8904]|uniref:1-phosphatidylinositol-3-phosphate 5-kinase n=1 Tax=Trichosporon asahii var. asahii (strain CBS 8904) TaxID=1220162 RepID=K1V150_TRIAC|nr:1-phosphatidylinositol-3-phosphate 5-kinase [Trichosporon asahii var. asahii CBS 8904]